VPTVYHRARFLMVGTLPLCPPYAGLLDIGGDFDRYLKA
jgi:hypothetical protein